MKTGRDERDAATGRGTADYQKLEEAWKDSVLRDFGGRMTLWAP